MRQQKDTDSPAVRKAGAIEEALRVIKKQFGSGAIMRLGGEDVAEVEVIPTGSLALDIALGVGGIPRGRVIEMYGPESSGKTTLALHAIAEAQARAGICAFIDAEHALDTAYAGRLGVQLDDLLVSQPDCGEQALEIADTLVRTGAVDLIVVDSVAALTPRAELEGDMGDAHMGLQARLMSQALRKLTAMISRTHTSVVFINQLRHKIGLVFGSPETTTGGNALKFYASVRLDIRRGKAIKKNDLAVGAEVRVKVVKNKLAPPFREAHFELSYGSGINRPAELLSAGEDLGVVSKAGAWYTYEAHRLGQGRERAIAYLVEHAEVADALRAAILVAAGVNSASATPTARVGASTAGGGATADTGSASGAADAAAPASAASERSGSDPSPVSAAAASTRRSGAAARREAGARREVAA